MSIVIASIDKNDDLFIAADKRAILSDGTIDDNYQKLFKLTDKLYMAGTGIGEILTEMKLLVEKFLISVPSTIELKEFIESLKVPQNSQGKNTAIVLAGKDENNCSFLVSKNSAGEFTFNKVVPDDIVYTISTNENVTSFSSKFSQFYLEHGIKNVSLAIKRTISYASTKDESISPQHEFVKIE